MKNKWLAIAKWVFVYPVLLVVCLELALQILGWGIFYRDDYSIQSSPENAFIGHPELGIQLNAGEYSITLNDSVHFIATHLEGNQRLVPKSSHSNQPDVLLLGCSFTYGYGVNNDENFAALLQEEFTDLSFQNLGVAGYGTVQSLMQLREALENDSLKAVVLNFSSFHFKRNGLSPLYRSNLKIGYERSSKVVASLMESAQFPYIKDCSLNIHFQPWETMYTNWWGRDWSAIVNWRQLADDRRKSKAIDELELATCLIAEMERLCKERGIPFGVACLDSTQETLLLQKRLRNVNWQEVDFDFENEELTNMPYDIHPGVQGHQYIAKRIKPFLNRLLNGQ